MSKTQITIHYNNKGHKLAFQEKPIDLVIGGKNITIELSLTYYIELDLSFFFSMHSKITTIALD
jgi:hypothetical protein